MLLNLFLAILLDSFTAVEEEDHETPEKKLAREQQRLEDLNIKDGEGYIEGMEAIQMDGLSKNQTKGTGGKKKKKKKGKKQDEGQSNILDESIEIDLEQLMIQQEETINAKKELFIGIECENALYIFSKVRLSTFDVNLDQ